MARILIVEDEIGVLHQLTHILRQGRHQVLSAQDAVLGMQFAVRESPELIITDVMMPGNQDGAFVGRLMKHTRTMNIPILVITGSQQTDIETTLLAAGATRVLRKPVIQDDVLAAIQEMLHLVRA